MAPTRIILHFLDMIMRRLLPTACLCALSLSPALAQQVPVGTTAVLPQPQPEWLPRVRTRVEGELVAKYGEAQRDRARRGLQQISKFWRAEDGDSTVFASFALENFAGTQPAVDTLFIRFQRLLEQYDGHMVEISREFRSQSDLSVGSIQPYDAIFAGYDPSAHFSEDMFGNKLAFTVLLNFPLTTLTQRLSEGPNWSRRQWAEARLAQRFSRRIPSEVNLTISNAAAEAGAYIADYNIWMHHLVDDRGRRLFPAKMRLLSHWNLRDEIKSDYTDAQTGLAKQRTIQQVMERIVTQTIPKVVIDNPTVDWNPFTNTVKPATVSDSDRPARDATATNAREPDTRYERLLNVYKAVRLADPYSPTAPTLIARRFEENREIPEERVKQMLEQVLTSPLVARTAALIRTRLGRPLEPFDIWYNGFRPKAKYNESELDRIVAERYPTPEAYRKDIPRMLQQLGFAKERAEYIAANIVVDPARGSGHAWGASMRSAKAHLRTRVENSGMNYKAYNIAVHEMGHNVEQTLSLNDIDNTLLQGVPNTAFTEALAFVFQGHDVELLGLAQADANTDALRTLNDFWGTYEIAGVGLVDMGVWHWMYDHPDATPAQLREATLQIARDVWNKYFAPIFGKRDVVLLAVYSHMIDSILYLPDYSIGHLIAHQIEEKMRSTGRIGPEFERMAKFGSLAPDLWMRNATGSPVGADAMLQAVERSLKQLGG
jgi:hypothetical protein